MATDDPALTITFEGDTFSVDGTGFSPDEFLVTDFRSVPVAPNTSTRGVTYSGYDFSDANGELHIASLPTSFFVPDEPRDFTVSATPLGATTTVRVPLA